jgi:protein-S-isoprenylcysteine O-methyltransferase Ste14
VADVALACWSAFGLLAFVLPVALQLRRTGSTGLKGPSGAPGSIEWLAGAGLVAAIALGVAAPLLAASDWVEPIGSLDRTVVHVAGIALFAIGLAGVVGSQQMMGRSWRVGVDESERTQLVTAGPFQLVRNPIFTAMIVAQLGIALIVPSVVALVGVALLVASLEAQTRLVEEPYLLRKHGRVYAEYAARVGRFLPGVGTLRRSNWRESA